MEEVEERAGEVSGRRGEGCCCDAEEEGRRGVRDDDEVVAEVGVGVGEEERGW